MVHANPGLRPGLSSAVPAGLILQAVGSSTRSLASVVPVRGFVLSSLKISIKSAGAEAQIFMSIYERACR